MRNMTQGVGSQKREGQMRDVDSTNLGALRRLRVRLIAEERNMNKETVQQIITEHLGVRKRSAK
jgi:hypothetical protein